MEKNKNLTEEEKKRLEQALGNDKTVKVRIKG